MTTPAPGRWRDRLKQSLPTPELLATNRWLKPIAHRICEPRLWHLQHEGVARAVAIGIFWAFAIPVGQVVVAAAHSVWWRANIPVAAGLTLITNPFTIGFWLWLAYQLGSLLLDAPPMVARVEGDSLFNWMTSFGGPALLGMGIFAVAGSIGGYLVVKVVWRLRVYLKRRYR